MSKAKKPAKKNTAAPDRLLPQRWPADAVERRPIAALIPYARNARTHSPAQVDQIAASIKEWGWTNPVLVAEDSTIIAGHGRVLAAHKLGVTDIPVMVAKGWTEAQKKAYLLADNQLALNAGWDEELLKVELGELSDLEFDLDLLGFDDKTLQELLASMGGGAGNTDADDAPEPPARPASRTGDLWVLGRHRLLCGDSTKKADVERLMAGKFASLIVTDPPYGVEFERGKFVGRDKRAKGTTFAPIANDELKGEELTAFIASALKCAFDVSKDVSIYVWSPSLFEGAAILAAVKAAGFKVQSQIVWRKSPFVLGRADYHWQHEVCWYGFKGGQPHPWYGGRDKGTVWDCPKAQKMDLHPTMKPVQLYATAIENSSKPGDLVLDLFAGGGPLAIACEQSGRCANMMEMEPAYADVIVRRWQDFTGQQATDENGRAFDEVAAERKEAA